MLNSNHKSGTISVPAVMPKVDNRGDSQLIADLARELHAKGTLDESKVRSQAAEHYAKNSKGPREHQDLVTFWSAAFGAAEGAFQQLARMQIDYLAGFPGPNDTDQLREVQRRLASLRNHLGHKAQNPPSTFEELLNDAKALSSAARSRLEEAKKAQSRATSVFAESVWKAVNDVECEQFLKSARDQLATKSLSYPSGQTPEAQAIDAGLLKLSGQRAVSRAVVEQYLEAEGVRPPAAASGLFSSFFGTAPQPAPPLSGYFLQLKALKEQLRTAVNGARLPAARNLLRLYQQSGSPALAYFAAMDCLKLHDTSHETLTALTKAARGCGKLTDVLQSLVAAAVDAWVAFDKADKSYSLAKAAAGGAPSPADTVLKAAEGEYNAKGDACRALFFHVFVVATELGDSRNADSSFGLLKKVQQDTSEQRLAKSAQLLRSAKTEDLLKGVLTSAHTEFTDKKNGPALKEFARNLSLEVVIRLRQLKPNDYKLEKLGALFLEHAPEDRLNWELALSHHLTPAAGAPINWADAEKLSLKLGAPVEALLVLGDRAVQVGETARAQKYLDEALNKSPDGDAKIASSLALARLHFRAGNESEGNRFLSQALQLSPHCDVDVRPAADQSGLAGLVMPDLSAAQFLNQQVPGLADSVLSDVMTALEQTELPLEEALVNLSEDFATLHNLLSNHSQLFQSQAACLKQITQLRETLTPQSAGELISRLTNPDPIIELLELVENNAAKAGRPIFKHYLTALEQAAKRLAPDYPAFAKLCLVDKEDQMAGEIRRLVLEVSDLRMKKSKTVLSKLLPKLTESLEEYERFVIFEIREALSGGLASLRAWSAALEARRSQLMTYS